jgi:PD-(D/E)XK nuclease superfamily protein
LCPREPSTEDATIDEDRLREALAESVPWAGVAQYLGLPALKRNCSRLQNAAREYGLDVSGLYGQAWGRAPVKALPVPFSRRPDASRLHQVGASAAMSWFLSRGYMVALPVETTTYDLIAESNSGLQRVQVKTSQSGKVVGISRTHYGAGKSPSTGKYGRHPYQAGEVDLFFIYTGAGSMYLIPANAVAEMTRLSLDRYSNCRLPES